MRGFVQDSWKMTPRLHVDYGIRVTSLTLYKAGLGATLRTSIRRSTIRALGSRRQSHYGQHNPRNRKPLQRSCSPQASAITPSSAAAWLSDWIRAKTQPRALEALHTSICSKLNKGLCGHLDHCSASPRLRLPSNSTRRPCYERAQGEFATRMGLLDNIFPGGNPPFQPFVTVAAVSGSSCLDGQSGRGIESERSSSI